MSDLQDLFDFLDDDALRIPIKSEAHPEGRDYLIPSPNAKTGMRLVALADIATKKAKGEKITATDAARLQLDDREEIEFTQVVLGSAYQEMLDDNVSHVRIQRAVQFAYVYFTQGKHAAEEAAKAGVFAGGKVQAPNRAQRRSQTRTTPSAQPVSTGSRRRRRR